jgi:hypothetical protein
MTTLATKTKARARARINTVRQLYCVKISFAALDTPNFFPRGTLDFRALKHHVFRQIIKGSGTSTHADPAIA